MKNKKLLYLLIPGTLLIWGMIFFKVLHAVKKDNDMPQRLLPATSESAAIANDTFSLSLNYKDPFRQSEKIPEGTGAFSKPVTEQVKQKKEVLPIVTAPWPQIVYGGVIKNQKSNKELALVQINGQNNIMRTGEILNDVELLKVFKDSIQVRYGKEKRSIKK